MSAMLDTAIDPPPFRLLPGAARPPLLLVCDHAGQAIPAALGDLGLAPRDRGRHAAYDIGAEWVARALAARFGAPLLLGSFSRLVVDLNRDPADPTSMPAESDGTLVPANRDLAPAARERRLSALFHPYHAAVEGLLADHPGVPLLSVHTCTPIMGGVWRPWQIGVLWGQDGRLALPLIAALRRDLSLNVGDNQPYSGRGGKGYTIARHGPGRMHASVELRQDLVATPAGAAYWAGVLGDGLAAVL